MIKRLLSKCARLYGRYKPAHAPLLAQKDQERADVFESDGATKEGMRVIKTKDSNSELLSQQCLHRLEGFSRIIVGFSGGLDSTVLLHILSTYSSLHPRIFAVHANHGISPNALFWQKHCEQFCLDLGVHFKAKTLLFDRRANIEEGARNARYALFSSLLSEHECLVLGHHMDDQAETLLLQLFRGAGVDGLAAMSEMSSLGSSWIARPFLSRSRKEIETYALEHQLHWIDDESNADEQYSRNYLRHSIMPLLEKKWPFVAKNLARTASHCQQAQNNLFDLASVDCPNLSKHKLHLAPLRGLNRPRMANVLRAFLKINAVQSPSTHLFNRIIDEAIFSRTDATPLICWNDVIIRRYQDYLYIDKPDQSHCLESIDWVGFPNSIVIANTRIQLSAVQADKGLFFPAGARIEIRFREGGEHFLFHGQRKKLKKLMQDWGIPPWLRGKIPLIYIDNQIAAVAGYAVSDLFYSKNYGAFVISFNTQEDSLPGRP